MGLLSNKNSRDKLKHGDQIYSWRTRWIYAHHGIYVGEGNVIQFTNAAGGGSVISSSSDSSATGNPLARCGFHSGLGGVLSSCIDCFLLNVTGYLWRFEYGVSPPYFLTRLRGGTCSLAFSDSPEDVLHRARYLLKNGFGLYSLFTRNCEDFSIYCKTGLILIGCPIGNRIAQTAVLSPLTAPAFGFASPLISLHLSQLSTEYLRLN